MRRERTAAAPGFDYQVARSNAAWCDHVARTNVTAGLVAWLRPASLIDPACGDASIPLLADAICHIDRMVLSDISRPNIDGLDADLVDVRVGVEASCLDVEAAIAHAESFDVIVLTEVLEHLEDPDLVLAMAREHASRLVASSPEMRPGQRDTNPEHLWQFDGEGYERMLMDAGWQGIQKTHLAFPMNEYDFQIWVCR